MRVSKNPIPVMTVERKIGRRRELVYLLLAEKPQKYPRGRSRIMYVGTTKKGVSRIAGSVATRSEQIFQKWGVRKIEVHVAWCTSVKKVQSWKLLERAILADFVSIYGRLPDCNRAGKSFQWDSKVSKYFRRGTITDLVKGFIK
jgi:hypothetical protein